MRTTQSKRRPPAWMGPGTSWDMPSKGIRPRFAVDAVHRAVPTVPTRRAHTPTERKAA